MRNNIPHDDDRDERLAALLRTTHRESVAPNRDFLAQLRETSAAAFEAPASPSQSSGSKGRYMYARLLGALAATAAAILVLIFSFQRQLPKGGDQKLTLAQVMDKTASAKTVQYKITSNGQTREVMAEKAGRWREDRGNGVYVVSDGEMAWRVDAKGKPNRDNTIINRDLMALLLTGMKYEKPDLAKIKSHESIKRGDDELLLYQINLESPSGAIRVDAEIDSKSKTIRTMTAKSAGKLLSELVITGIDGELPEEKFVVLNTLSEDGRVGKLTDTQGVVSVKPMAQSRWTPVGADFVVMPGDWLRTDARGANAAALKLISRTSLIVGPASVVEISKSTQIKLSEGEVEISAPKGSSIELIGPEDQRVVVKDTHHYYLDKNQKLRESGKQPLWLKGFKGATANESIGSLVAKVDGRNEPLSVGYHKVTVDIRDQIARTTIEESFVNHTNATLEGVFHFPLPQDASISEFGMWIGNELVMADVVEKQRAREIYEEIMREKRDPGLLEWAGGNIFKARVWPIFGGSEKRIKITYTQVLPLKGNKYTYNYALQSEMLQQHPLRELSLTVNVASAVPLKRVWSPTHSTRDQATAHAARVEFTAQEYTPRKDFEVAIEQDKRGNDVVLIPHRRGDDGYFLLQVMPPAISVDRAVLPDGGPIRLLILADTSASMDRKQRQQQEAFIASLVSSLTPNDAFNLACCDVTTDWAFENLVPADGKNLIVARQMLEHRRSLGWSNLDQAFAAMIGKADAKTHVVYVGDGIPVTSSADPQEFVKRLKNQYLGKAGTFHAVATGSSYEPGVMKGIASLGGGSWRRIGAEQGPTAVALELLREIAQPTLRDLKVEFKGLRTARVYPSELPNVPAGMQQILLGRYLPEGKNQQGEVIVSGTLDGKPVTMSTNVTLQDAESGNSFIPRLWARHHLDVLLEQGSSESIKDEIIALSEEYNILTPYTSFLVLESDRDRERFGVKKRFRMRDGEKFFAEGRDSVDFALMQQQMKRAGAWRVNLRREVLRSLAALGRRPQALRVATEGEYLRKRSHELSESVVPTSTSSPTPFGDTYYANGEELGTSTEGGGWGKDSRGGDRNEPLDAMDSPKPANEPAGSGPDPQKQEDADEKGDDKSESRAKGKKDNVKDLKKLQDYEEDDLRQSVRELDSKSTARDAEVDGLEDTPFTSKPGGMPRGPMARGEAQYAQDGRGFYFKTRLPTRRYDDSLYWQQQWWSMLLPLLPAPAKPAKPAASKWPESAQKLSQLLLRRDQLAGLKGGLEIVSVPQSFDHRYGEVTSEGRGVFLHSPKSWLSRWQYDKQQTVINWCNDKERGLIHQAFGVGRLRASEATELAPSFDLNDFSISSLEESYGSYAAAIEEAGQNRARLILKSGQSETRATIDTDRRVLLSLEYFAHGKLSSATKFTDFVEVAGRWFATKIESANAKGERTSLTTLTIKDLSNEQFGARIAEELAGREQVLFVNAKLPSLSAARMAQATQKLTLEDHIVLMQHFAAIQQWTKAREHLESIERITNKPAKRWYRGAISHLSRRFDELRQRHLEEADRLAAAKLPVNDAYAIASHLYSRSSQFMQTAEMIPLHVKLAPIYKMQPAHTRSMREYEHARYYLLSNLGRVDEAIALLKKLATDYARDEGLQREYAQALFNGGDFNGGYAWIAKALAANPKWSEYEEENLRNLNVQYLTQQGRTEEILKYVEAWMARNFGSRTPYLVYLSTLIRLDQEAKALEVMRDWFKAGMVKGEMSPAVAGRFGAAVSQALGQGHFMSTYRVEERWLPHLAEVVRTHAHDPLNGHFADQIMQQVQSHPHEIAVKLRAELAAFLLEHIPTLTPDRLDRLVNWLHAHHDEATWKKLIDALRKRWDSERDLQVRYSIGHVLSGVLQRRSTPGELLAFLREVLKQAPKNQRPGAANHLFDTLLSQPWKQELEDEAFALLPELTDDNSVDALRPKVDAIYRLTDRMVAARNEALNQKIDRPDQLPRTELRDKRTANLKTARTEFADRLAKEMTRAAKELTPWIKMERMYLDTVLERNQAQVEADCWEILGSEPPKPVDPEAEIKIKDVLETILKERAFAMVNYFAAQRKAEPALIKRLIAYLDKGIAQEGDESSWKMAKHRLLVALDRPKDLEGDLRKWIATTKASNYWRVHLGFLVAELGRLNEAVEQFEKVHADSELGPMAYRSLADWYMALNRKDKHEQALLNRYRFTEEYQLSRMIQQRLYPWQRGDSHLPSELDKEVLRMFAVLFEKSASPAQYVYQIQQFYQACRDFRLLAVLADAVVGQTPVKIYPFLQNLGHVFNSIQDEAVVDQMMEQIDKARKTAKTATDLRALDLMEVLTRRRAAELKNQAGPHGDAALTALKRAFEREWVDGEHMLMSSFLYSLGTIAYNPLAEEQRREMKSLHERQKKATLERLQVAYHYSYILNSYGQNAAAIDVLNGELTDFIAAHNGNLPVAGQESAALLVSFLRQSMHHARAETFLQSRLGRALHEEQRFWITDQLLMLYHDALARDSEVSLGKGPALYAALEKKLRTDAARSNPYHQYRVVAVATQVYATAKEKQIAAYREDILTFANKLLPEVMKFHHNYYDSTVSHMAQSIRNIVGPLEALEYVLNRVESEPSWFRLNNQDGWSRYGGSMAVWRSEAKVIGNLEPRLLKVTLAELRRDLDTMRATNRSIYTQHSGYYWAEKAGDFISTAEEVYEKRKNSGASVVYIAEYFYHGVGRTDRAVEILYAAHKRELLDQGGISTLVQYLRQLNRHLEAVALLEPLVGKYPGNWEYRAWLMNSYFRTSQKPKLMALLKDTHDYFHKENRWHEGMAGAMGGSCMENELWSECAEYYKEAIALRQRGSGNRGIGDGVLAEYYSNQARAYSRLGRTADAVDAASGAIVAWPSNHGSRQHYLNRLHEVLTEAKDLDAFVAQLDGREKESGLGSPVIRKSIAKAYQAKAQFAQAIVQFKIAAELQPEDFETHDQLIACYDQVADKEGAINATFEALQLSRRNLALYRKLGDRLQTLKRLAEAERAFTSIVEMQPNEAESHALLAEVRQQNDRWSDAVPHWEQAAKQRALEPTALIELAKAQMRLARWNDADATITKLERTVWPARFDNQREAIRGLRVQLQGKK